MCHISDLLGETSNEGASLRYPFSLIDREASAIAKALSNDLKRRSRHQFAMSAFRYDELANFIPQLVLCISSAPKTNITTQVIQMMRSDPAVNNRKHIWCVRRQLVRRDWLPPQSITDTLWFQSLLEDAKRDSRKGIVMVLFTIQLHERMRPYLLGMSQKLCINDSMLLHFDAFDEIAHYQSKLIGALITEQLTSNVDILNDAVLEISSAARTLFSVPCDIPRPSSLPDIRLVAGLPGYSYPASVAMAA